MNKNKFGSYQIGQQVNFGGELVIILDKIKGNKTKKLNKQEGIETGFISNPCLYKLSNGLNVRGSTLKKHQINLKLNSEINKKFD